MEWNSTLIDTGNSNSYIASHIVYSHGWHIHLSNTPILMTSTTLSSITQGHRFTKLVYYDNDDPSMMLLLLLGYEFLKQYKQVNIAFGGPKPPFSLCDLTEACVDTPSLFRSLSPHCKTIATIFRCLSLLDQKFVESEVSCLSSE